MYKNRDARAKLLFYLSKPIAFFADLVAVAVAVAVAQAQVQEVLGQAAEDQNQIRTSCW